MLWYLCELPEELLCEIARAGLSPASFSHFRCVSRTVHKILDQEPMWEHISLSQWPAAAPTCGTWRHFVLCGGGAKCGRLLFSHLKFMNEELLKCPESHDLQRFHAESDGFYCDLCGSDNVLLPRGAVIWGCRKCNY